MRTMPSLSPAARVGLLSALVLSSCSSHEKGTRHEDEPVLTEDDASFELPDATARIADENEDASSLDSVSSPLPDAQIDAQADEDASDAMVDATMNGPDGGALGADGGSERPPRCLTEKVDLLFMIDNSGSMAEEQRKLGAVLPQLINVLTTGNRNGLPSAAGQPTDFPAARSIHIGVVSSDLGIAGITGQQSCGEVSFDATAPDPSNPAVRSVPINAVRLDKPRGDDGVLNTSVAVALAGIWARPAGSTFTTPVALVVPAAPECANVSLPAGRRYVEYEAGVSNRAAVVQEFSCIAKLGKNGCGIEQQLESMLKAVTPQSSPLLFAGATTGQGNPSGANQGFLRDDAVLAIVNISDEDDCSVPDVPSSRELYNGGSATITEDINIRCGLSKYASLLQPTMRYVDGLRTLKNSADNRVIFANIVGAPLGNTLMGRADLDALLARPEMQFTPRPISGTTLYEPTPACVSSADGSAAPGRRFVEIARELDRDGIVGSICQDSYADVITRVGERVARHLGVTCTP